MSASKAFASASRSSGLKTESTGLAVAPSYVNACMPFGSTTTRGNRAGSLRTQVGE